MIMMLLIVIICLLTRYTNLQAETLNDIYDFSELNYFPDTIPIFNIRKDRYTNLEVSRGRLQQMKFDASQFIQLNHTKKISIKDFNKIAQCSNPTPDLDGNRGSFSMLRMTSITKKTLETACAHLETGCLPYVKCKEYIMNSKLNKYDPNYQGFSPDRNPFKMLLLLRIKDNSLYYDWPWGNERFNKDHTRFVTKVRDHFLLISMVLSFIKDLGNSFFFFGGERPSIPWYFTIPLFSFAPSIGTGDLPFPWLESYRDEFHRNRFAAESNNNYTDGFYQRYNSLWHERIPKAAFYASFDSNSARQIVYDQAAFRPDLFDVQFSMGPYNIIRAWNLASDESDFVNAFTVNNEMLLYKLNLTSDPIYNDPKNNNPGFIQPILKFGKFAGYNPAKYKYVIVPAGSGILSTSGRLASLLAHSGAVILLQEAGFSYHFSARLQPWVHYVPLAYNMADATAKIEWLRTHDDLAQQIRQNAINFGKSYLRLEDYYCYVANSLIMLANMQKEGGATEHSSKATLLESF